MPEIKGVTKEALLSRQSSYKATFHGEQGQVVLDDLAYFCRADETCVVLGDRDATLVLEGRREAFLRIMDHLNIPPEDLWDKYK